MYIGYLSNHCKEDNFTELYFSKEILSYLSKLSCFIWELAGLTELCCRYNTYIITKYEDGHEKSNYCCACMFNWFFYFLKRLGFFMTFISYYIFYLIFIIFWFWFIAQLIYSFLKKKKIM